MKIFFGLRPQRAKQWGQLVCRELAPMTWPQRVRTLANMLRVLAGGPVATRSEWFRRERCCLRCDLYDPTLRRCKPYDNSPLGCGCWTPLVALYEVHCWGYWNLPGTGIGW